MIAEELVIFELGIIERVFAEDDPGVGSGRRAAADGRHDGLAHLLGLARLQTLQRRPVAAVGRVTQHYHFAIAAHPFTLKKTIQLKLIFLNYKVECSN